MQSTSLTRTSLWLVARRPVFKFLWGLSLSGITGWIALQEGGRACGFWSCVFYDKGIPFWIALLPWSPGGSGSGSRQSVCAVSLTSSGVYISPAIVLLLQQAEDCGVCAALRPALPALPSPASLHPTTAALVFLCLADFEKQLFGLGWCRRPGFPLSGESCSS